MPNINLNYKMVTDIKNNFFTNNRFIAAESLPAEGDFVKGDLIVNIGENANDEAMWLCVKSGNPGVWEVVGAGVGGGSSKIVTLKSRVVVNEALSEVNIGVSGFNKATDTLLVFNNARFMVEGVDYEINADSTKIVAMNGNIWNEKLANDYVFDFVAFKMMNVNENGDVVVSSANEIVKLKNTVVVNEAVNEVEIGIDGFNKGDDLTVYRNSVYMIEGIDYEVQGNKIVSLKGNWNAEGGSDYKFTFEVLKAVAKVNPDAVIGMEHLTEDVKEAIEAAGNIDLSGKQDKTDNGLVTTDKTIVGAINELFQDVDSGKQLIADAIDDSSINKNSTFSAMSEAIEGIQSQVTTLQLEATTNRGNLTTVLTDEGVELTGDETLADLIVKTDEEFDDKKNEIDNIRSTIVNILENKGVEVNPEDGLDSILDNISNIKRSAYPDWYSEGDAWISATSVPVNICSSPAAVVDENIYLMGGYTGSSTIGNIYKYNTKNNTWETKSSMPAAKYGSIAEAVDGKVYCIGGFSSNKTNYCYDPITDSCTTKTAMTAGKRQSASSTVNGKIYVIAGYTTALVKTNYCYDTTTNAWTTKAAAPNSFRSAAAVNVNDKIYVIGGVGSDERYDAMVANYCYDTTTNTWTTKAALQDSNYVLKRFGHGACYYKNKIYAFGGHMNNTTAINSGYTYDVNANTWTALTASDMPFTAGYYSYALVGNTYYMFGGQYFSSSGVQVLTNYRKLSRCFVLKL